MMSNNSKPQRASNPEWLSHALASSPHKSLSESVNFYQSVLGFVLIKRPSSFNFEGAWLYNYGMGIHLLQSKDVPQKPSVINPKDTHISFQCADVEKVKAELKKIGMEHVTATVEDGGIKVDQLFFHDPDGNMIEICNCQNLPVLPLIVPPLNNSPSFQHIDNSMLDKAPLISRSQEWMMENLQAGMIHIAM